MLPIPPVYGGTISTTIESCGNVAWVFGGSMEWSFVEDDPQIGSYHEGFPMIFPLSTKGCPSVVIHSQFLLFAKIGGR